MADENVNRWKQQGRIYFWRYTEGTRNYPGWQLTADRAFCDGFADLIDRMLNASYNCEKSLNVTPPTQKILGVPNNRGGSAKWKAPKLLILKHRKDNPSEDYSFLEENENAVEIGIRQTSHLRVLAKSKGQWKIVSHLISDTRDTERGRQ